MKLEIEKGISENFAVYSLRRGDEELIHLLGLESAFLKALNSSRERPCFRHILIFDPPHIFNPFWTFLHSPGKMAGTPLPQK
jgi:hypothetical protein